MQLLIGKDQLLQEAERGKIFNGYCEGTLSFKPTYKYDIGSSDYDTSYKVYNVICRNNRNPDHYVSGIVVINKIKIRV